MVTAARYQLRPGLVTSSLTDTVRPGPFWGQLWRVSGKGLREACVGIQVHEVLWPELHLLPVPGLQAVLWCGRPYSTGPTQILGFVAPQALGFILVPPGGAIIIFIARVAPHERGGERLAGGTGVILGVGLTEVVEMFLMTKKAGSLISLPLIFLLLVSLGATAHHSLLWGCSSGASCTPRVRSGFGG